MFDAKKIIKEKYGVIILFTIFIFSFALNLYVLTRYSLSYGIDGAFYNYQITSILKTGFPIAGDPPLAYYLLTPFTLVGGQLLGLKIGTAFFGAVLAFPAYYLTEFYISKKNDVLFSSSKVPSLLSAFLITVNVDYFTMVGSYGILQNLIGVVFLVTMLYYAIKWMENSNKNIKYGLITIFLLACNLLTHIYTGALAVILFFALISFTIVFKKLKTGKIPFFEVKILALFGVLVAGAFAVLFAIYPIMFSKFSTFLSFFGLSSTSQLANMGANTIDNSYNYFCSLPYILGIFAVVILLKRGFKDKLDDHINPTTLLAWSYLVLAAVMAVLTFVSSEYQSRFLLLSFVPIALLVPLGLKYVESESIIKKPTYKTQLSLLIAGIAVIFAFSSFYTASATFSSIGPSISEGQYAELQAIKENATALGINENTTLVASDFTTHYWIEFVFDQDVQLGNTPNNGTNQSLYYITLSDDGGKGDSNQQRLMMGSNVPGSFFLPYGPSLLSNSADVVNIGNQSETPGSNGMQQRDGKFNDTHHPNGTMNGTAPPGAINGTVNGTSPPNRGNATPPQKTTNGTQNLAGNFSANGQMNPGTSPVNGRSGGSNSINSLVSAGTLLYNGSYVKVYKISS